MKIVIPMSGSGSRFVKAGYAEPKPLIMVDGQPMIRHVVNLFKNSEIGTASFTFICNTEHVETTNVLEVLKKIEPNCKILTIAPHKKGPVWTVSTCIDQIFPDEESLQEEVIVSYCDYGTGWNFAKFLADIKSSKVAGSVAAYRGFHPHMLGKDNYAFIRADGNMMLEIQEKKPFTNNRMNEFASNGTYYFSHGSYVKKYFQQLIDEKIEINGEYYVSLVYNLMIRDNLPVSIFEIDYMLQWGTPYDLSIYQMWSNYFKNRHNYSQTIKHPVGTTMVLPLAGRGNRFATVGYDVPKPLLDVDGEAMVVQAGRSLPSCDKNIFIVLQEHIDKYKIDNVLKSKFENSQVIGINGVTEGQACTCEIGIRNLDPELPICITACDNGVVYNEKKYLELLNDDTVDCIIWSFRNNPTSINNPKMYAWMDVDENQVIKKVYVKECPFDNPLERHVIIGTMFFRKAKYFMDGLKDIYETNTRTNGEFYVDNLLNPLIEKGFKVKVFESDFYVCWGTPDDYKTYLYWKNYFNSVANVTQ